GLDEQAHLLGRGKHVLGRGQAAGRVGWHGDQEHLTEHVLAQRNVRRKGVDGGDRDRDRRRGGGGRHRRRRLGRLEAPARLLDQRVQLWIGLRAKTRACSSTASASRKRPS